MKQAVALGAAIVTAGLASTVEAAPFDWTGFYVGVHAGYAVGNEHDNQSDLFAGPGGTTATTNDPCVSAPIGTLPSSTVPSTCSADQFAMSGFIGGVHAGYNLQMDRIVLGLEGGIDFSGIKGGMDADYGSGNLRRLDFESLWQGSVSVRAGFTPLDRLLLYVTGGGAIATGKLTNTSSDLSVTPTTDTNTHLGWTAGIGADYAFTDNWIGSFAVRYSDFGSKSYETYDGPVKVDWNQTVGTIGLSYKF
ncbi:MAG TPA: outer membrane protein [Devosiaceae bacterium]